jgi:DNA-binding protein Fis
LAIKIGYLGYMATNENEIRTEALREAIEAARGEYLEDATGTPEDEAYNQAVSDVAAAIGALLEEGK